jgi:hypothetical protein
MNIAFDIYKAPFLTNPIRISNQNPNMWCLFLGHDWKYYNNQITEKRVCERCNHIQYKFKEWEDKCRD